MVQEYSFPAHSIHTATHPQTTEKYTSKRENRRQASQGWKESDRVGKRESSAFYRAPPVAPPPARPHPRGPASFDFDLSICGSGSYKKQLEPQVRWSCHCPARGSTARSSDYRAGGKVGFARNQRRGSAAQELSVPLLNNAGLRSDLSLVPSSPGTSEVHERFQLSLDGAASAAATILSTAKASFVVAGGVHQPGLAVPTNTLLSLQGL